MINRRTFSQTLIAALATTSVHASASRPIIFWFFTTEAEGIHQCPVSDGFLVASIDLPCHGEDRRPNEPDELAGWRYRLEHGENLLETVIRNSSQKLDHLLEDNPTRNIIVGGISRGAFVAMHLGMRDPRFHSVVALSPVTELMALDEFKGFEGDTLPLNASVLAQRKLFFSIESQDDRVSTTSTIELVKEIVEHKNPDITLYLEPGNEHTITPWVMEKSRQWIIANALE